jgi:hypothetical protein
MMIGVKVRGMIKKSDGLVEDMGESFWFAQFFFFEKKLHVSKSFSIFASKK